MKYFSCAFLLGLSCAGMAFGDSLLTAQSFPKTFNDLPFATRLEILREGYTPYAIEYDSNGVCVSGCAYNGITIKEDMAAVDEANQQMANIIAASETKPQGRTVGTVQSTPSLTPEISTQPTQITAKNWCQNGKSTKLPLRYPVDMSNFKYKISSDFGFRTASANGARFHPALDIACPSGTPVYATADGVVATVANETKPGGAGNYINILHDNGLITQYLHLNKILVKKGDRVSACQQIALSGNSGISVSGQAYAAHLDYRIRFNSDKNNYVDILCPCKASTRIGYGTSSDTDLECAHSLFNADYKFKSQANKRSAWRVEHGHCMKNLTDLLPDEKL